MGKGGGRTPSGSSRINYKKKTKWMDGVVTGPVLFVHPPGVHGGDGGDGGGGVGDGVTVLIAAAVRTARAPCIAAHVSSC